jgi:hypothetical protein
MSMPQLRIKLMTSASENMALTEIQGPKTAGWICVVRTVHQMFIVRVIKSQRISRTGHVSRMQEKRYTLHVSAGEILRDHTEDLSVNGTIILK